MTPAVEPNNIAPAHLSDKPANCDLTAYRRQPRLNCRLFAAAIIILLLAAPSIWLARQYRQVKLNRALIAAIKKSDASTVDALLAAGADPNARDTPEKHLSFKERIHDLLRAPIDLSDTALKCATYKQAPRIVKVLITNGADVNAQTKDTVTPLMWAANNGDIESVKALIAAHAAVNAKDDEGDTALIFIADSQFDNSACTRALIAAGADVNAKNIRGETALAHAELSEIEDVLKAAGGKK